VDDLQKRTGLDIPIHVDGASGGFIAPFAYPNLKWSFDVPRVVSINTSGHKFGLVYPGLGWVMWRDESYLHKELIFELRMEFFLYLIISYPQSDFFFELLVDYLGSTEFTFTLLVYSIVFFQCDLNTMVLIIGISPNPLPRFSHRCSISLILGSKDTRKLLIRVCATLVCYHEPWKGHTLLYAFFYFPRTVVYNQIVFKTGS
jgi:Pyridoxal-dependent decarboxylase conserved domain